MAEAHRQDSRILPEKIINDPIHGTLKLNLLYMKIIDTPQFQRLRRIKQLGGVQYVYPGATHSRFEHSLGVCHLAELMARNLQNKQPELKIDETDILCVGIAGLCHDLGHGPFSHLWEDFMNAARPNEEKWKHEKTSFEMFHLIWSNLSESIRNSFKLSETDLIFIQELINVPDFSNTQSEQWQFKGREKKKSFLYDIVSNKKTGVDVDKWDYFLRDCHYLGFKDTFDYQRLLQSARVIQESSPNGLRHICFRDKEVFNLYQMFHVRWILHRKACYHRVSRILNRMFVDIFLIVDKFIKITGEDGSQKCLSECCDDVKFFTNLNDTIVDRIMIESEPHNLQNSKYTEEEKGKLKRARELLQRIVNRKLYTEVGCAFLESENDETTEKTELYKSLKRKGEQPEEACYYDITTFNYGKNEQDPINKVKFYRKQYLDEICPEKINQDLVSRMLPSKFEEKMISCVCRQEDSAVQDIERSNFKQFCRIEGLRTAIS